MYRILLVLVLLIPATFAEESPAPPAEDLAKVREAFLARLDIESKPFEAKLGEARESDDGVVTILVEFPSPFTSIDPEKNDTVRGALFHRADPEPAAVIAMSGWGGEPLTPMLAKRLAAETKLQVLHIQMPFQEGRTPKGRRSGELTLSADLEQSLASFVQAVLDIRRAADWLVSERKVDPKRIGVMGTSLGGFMSSAVYGMDDRFACCAAQLAGADVVDVIFNGNFLTTRIARKFEADGVSREAVEKALRPACPATWARAERKEGFLLVAAEKDKIVTLANAKELARLYGDARLELLKDAGHIAFMELQEVFPKVKEHLVRHLSPEKESEEGDD